MDKVTFEKLLKRLNDGASVLTQKHEIEGLVSSVVGIDETHPLFETLVNKLCDKFEIDTNTEYEDQVDNLELFLTSCEGVNVHPYKEGADINLFAEAIVNKYNTMHQRLTMQQLRKIALNTGFVVKFKSVKPIINILNN